MKRRLFNLLALVSLVLLLGVAALRWTGTGPSRQVQFYSSTKRCTLELGRRGFFLVVMGGTRSADGAFRAPAGRRWNGSWANPTHTLPLGFAYGKSPARDPTAAFYFGLAGPWWPLFLLAAAAPALWLALAVRAHRRRRCSAGKRLCPKCGYDLRATPDRCPECGTPSAAGGAA